MKQEYNFMEKEASGNNPNMLRKMGCLIKVLNFMVGLVKEISRK